jgi:hypothetical protein
MSKVFLLSVKTIAHCFALPQKPLGAREDVSALIGAAFGLNALNVVQKLLSLATDVVPRSSCR